MPEHSISRRAFVAGSIAAGAGVAATTRVGSAGPIVPGGERMRRMQDGEVVYARAVDTMPSSFNESPMLKERVEAGDLPPVEERLPKNPLVIQPIEIGQYGGLARVGNITTNIGGYDLDFLTERRAYFLRYTPDLADTELSLASSLEISDDKTTYTITLREGLKFSDGAPVSTADIMFWYEDILLNEDLTPVVSRDLQPGGEVVKVTAIDDLTVEFKFAVPNPRFVLSQLAHQTGGWYKAEHIQPAHFLKEFHPNHNPDADKLAKDGGWNTWMEMFGDKADRNITPERPSLSAFICKADSGTVVTWERNPYYWAVDSEGNQLPYIDTIEMERLQDVESYHAKIVSGAYDYAVGNTDILNFSTYEGSAEQAGYRTLIWSSGRGSEVFFQFNMNFGTEEMQKVHQDPRFRQALSLAINRQEMNDLLFFGAAEVRQMTVLPTSVHFKEEYASAWIDYDLDQANALLDEMGLTWNDDHTVRLMADGEPLQYQFDYFDGEGPKTQILELITEYWREVGVIVNAKSITRQLLLPRVQTNEEPMSMWHGDASTDILLPIDPKWSIGKYGDESSIAPLWTQWFNTQGAEGVEPAEFFLSGLNTWQEFRDTLNPELAAQLLQAQADNLWSIGTVGLTPWPFIVKNRIHNVPETGIHTWDGLFQYPYHASTVFIRE